MASIEHIRREAEQVKTSKDAARFYCALIHDIKERERAIEKLKWEIAALDTMQHTAREKAFEQLSLDDSCSGKPVVYAFERTAALLDLEKKTITETVLSRG